MKFCPGFRRKLREELLLVGPREGPKDVIGLGKGPLVVAQFPKGFSNSSIGGLTGSFGIIVGGPRHEFFGASQRGLNPRSKFHTGHLLGLRPDISPCTFRGLPLRWSPLI